MKNIEKYQSLLASGEVDALLLTSEYNRLYAAQYGVAEGVAAEGDDYGRTVTFCVGHDCLLFGNKKTNPLKWDEKSS